jgi:mono/diheme cytochrome c family protein
MSIGERSCFAAALLLASAAWLNAQQLPAAPGRETVQKLCGTCHSAAIVAGRGRTHDEWSEVVTSMISRGAKGTQAEFAQVIDYLSRNLPPNATPGPAPASPRRRGGGGGFSTGPDDKQIVDPTAAARGKAVYNAQCVGCHGPEARGDEKGPDLVRSLTILHDRYGSTLKPFLQQGHPAQSGAHFTAAQIADLSHFLHQQVENTLRSGPYSKVLNVLTGDATAGAVYFNGAGGCNACHSPTGDLAGIASKYDAPTLQQHILFPGAGGFGRRAMTLVKPTTVTVTTPGGESVSGIVEKIDDFNVSLRDSSGDYRSFARTPGVKVEKHDPYLAHEELLDKYTDKDIHDLVAYLETLK